MNRFTTSLAVVATALLGSATPAQTGNPPTINVINVPAGDTTALIAAINQANSTPGPDEIFLGGGTYVLPTELPPITSGLVTIDGRDSTLQGSGTGHGLIEVRGNGSLGVSSLTIRDFRNDQSGGAISVGDDAAFGARNTTFVSNSATGNGGAISVSGNADIGLSACTFFGNAATGAGGAISYTSTGSRPGPSAVQRGLFQGNTATGFGCCMNLAGSMPAGESFDVVNNQFEAAAGCRAIIENPSVRVRSNGNTFVAPASVDQIHTTAPFQIGNSILSSNTPGGQQQAVKTICSDFGSSTLMSLGGNLSSDASCNLNQPTDQVNVDPRLGPKDPNGYFTLAANSPAIDRGGAATSLVNGVPRLPCGYADARGLGRPQDGNNDGTHACDSGSYEVQGGANLTGSYSAAYFDTSRGGEGTLLEILDGGIAFVAKFTYRPNGGTAWFTGVGNVVGNSVVLDDFSFTTGGVFGPAFNSANVQLVKVGGASYNFSTCDSNARPGKLAFAAEPGNGYEDLLVNASRLTSIVPCTGAPSANAGRSGSFFSPTRGGEGILVQFLPDGRVFLVWYTYDPQGNQFWIVSGDVTVNGNVVTAQMLYPATTTRFGSQFNSSQISLQPWGTVTLTYTGCDNLTFAYSSTVAGFGTGQYNYQRLTRLSGTTCTP
jgi:predicted outer membrane repeat protein